MSLRNAIRIVMSNPPGSVISVRQAARLLKLNIQPPISLKNLIRLAILPPPNIVQFDPPTEILPANRPQVTLMWNVVNCENSCSIRIDMRTSISDPWVPLTGATDLPARGTRQITVPSPSGAYYKFTASFPGKPSVSMQRSYGISGGGGELTPFYFKLQGDSEIVPCYVVLVLAPDRDTARRIAQAFASNYRLTDSNLNEFNNPGNCQQVTLRI